jgi:hypothetical protein
VSGKVPSSFTLHSRVKLPRIKLYTFNQLPSCGYPTIPILVSSLPFIIIHHGEPGLPSMVVAKFRAATTITDGNQPIYIMPLVIIPSHSNIGSHSLSPLLHLPPPASNIIHGLSLLPTHLYKEGLPNKTIYVNTLLPS